MLQERAGEGMVKLSGDIEKKDVGTHGDGCRKDFLTNSWRVFLILLLSHFTTTLPSLHQHSFCTNDFSPFIRRIKTVVDLKNKVSNILWLTERFSFVLHML